MAEDEEEFYVRYYVGHKGKFGHEFLEFEFRPDGLLRYANNSKYKGAKMIRKEVRVGGIVLEELKRIIELSEITKENDKTWPKPDEVGRQELEVVIANQHISFVTAKIGSVSEIEDAKDSDGLKLFYFLIQDLRCMIFSLIGMHFKIKPI
eukprot:CAMPEP_0114506488 /NCGR_PEP_ID=MMETSP0109-20121206/11453_1 /TAXON_ID=29199 /ORGANISM="Chlorarachnion reptans, Strain CCCM449" /LENGTH=149 /DNA_ID=CAMNT_0001685077 /DNA_START=98 /DNA_END=547 /DNA_ORIENTATION=-